MWNKGKQSISSGDDSTNVIAGRDVYLDLRGNVPTGLIDQKTEEEVEKLKKSRLFLEFDRVRASLSLGRRLTEGDLSGGSVEARGQALAWCARVLSRSEELERAEELVDLAKNLGDSPEAKIAEAFILSQRGDKAAALSLLADIDSDVSHAAGLMIVVHHDGVEGGIDWMGDAGYTTEDLDAEGRCFLLNYQLQLGRWDEVAQTVSAISKPDFDETPSLHHLVGLATLVPAIPRDFRAFVLAQVPFEAADFRLASDALAMDARNVAQTHFLDAVKAAKRLGCPRAARMDDEYALWLELRDPAQRAHGIKRLENKLRDLSSALGFVHYAIQFGVKLDIVAVEREIERCIAINGGMTNDAAIARFSLAFAQSTPEEAANYIARHHNQLSDHINAELIWYRQIEMLSHAGLIERANEVLEQLLEEGLAADQESKLRRIISEAQGSDPIEALKAHYEETKALGDLISLVGGLEGHQHWDDLCEFGELLFKETHSLGDAERLVNAYRNTSKPESIVCFLKENTDLLSQSKQLRMSYAWALYDEGAFLESRAALAELSDDAVSPNYRALQVNLGIAMGDWASLSAYIADEYRNRNDRSAHELINAAQLALHTGSPYAKSLVFYAAAKADDDSAVLANAYFISTSAGWEDDPQVFHWLEKAAKLSGDEGPLRRINLRDIIDQKPEWDRRESETWRLLAQGQLPIFLAAQSLNRTLIDLTAFPALSNLTETDPRRRSVIPAYSGMRVPQEFDVVGKAVALDATALLTLSFLKILEVVLDTFETVYIPHSTLGWLFNERQKASFHQPSRIADARQVRDLLSMGRLANFTPSTVVSSALSAQVGDELAALIAEAEKVRDDDDTQHIVVRSAPVHRISSLMEEEADLSAHSAVLSSCLAVVEKLRQKGQLTADEEKRARAYLQLNEKTWPNQPAIDDGATLYLDDLAISYLQHLGFLGKLKAAGLKAVVSPAKISDADALISYERISEDVQDVIERIRAALNSRIESGHVRVSSRCNYDELDGKLNREHPSASILALASECDLTVIDDRFLNKYGNINSRDANAPIFSTLSLLDALVVAGVLSDDDRLEHRTRLRRAGYVFIPVSVEELERCLSESTVVEGKVVETAELKAIRESILRVRMSDWLRLPEEASWLDGTLKAFVRMLKKLWEDRVNIAEITALSNWLVDPVDIRGWAHCLVPENADNVVRIGRAPHIMLLLMPPTGAQKSVVEAYWSWIEDKLLIPIQEQFPELYKRLVDSHRSYFTEMAESQVSEGGQLGTNSTYERATMASAALELIPPLIRKSLLNDQSFREEFGFETEAMITFGATSVSVQRSELFDAVRIVLAGEDSVELTDAEGRIWNLMNDIGEGELPNLVLSSGQQRLLLPDFSVLSRDPSTRIRCLEETASDVNFPLGALDEWRSILQERALDDDEFDTFHSDIRDTPVYVARAIRNEIMEGKSSASSLVPNSRRYFERLVGVYDGSASIKDYAVGAGQKVFEELTEWRPFEGFLFSLLLSSHSALSAELSANHLNQNDLESAFNFLENYGDMLSRLGAFEVGVRMLPNRPELEPFLLRLVHLIRDDDVQGEASEFKLFSALFVLVDGELARTRLLTEEPPYYRRLASLAHAALIHRQLVQCGIDYQRFCDWAVSNRGEHYYMQTLADMRSEPRWPPELAAAPQMQADFFGRILIAGNNSQANLGEGELRDTILGDGEQSLIKLCEFPRPYLPGPLEGAEGSPNTLPDDLALNIEYQLDSDEVEATSFIALVNSAMIFRITSGHAELAAKALKLGNYTLANLEDKSQLVGILNGLATVAAVSRNSALADELRILVRRYRRDSEYGFSIEEAMRICLVACAGREDLMDWRQFAGEWLTELAFGELGGSEGEVLHSHLLALLHSVPELWVSCAKADAALKAWRFR